MKNNIYLTLVSLILIVGASCSYSPKNDYVTFSGTIIKPNSDSLVLVSFAGGVKPKVIQLNANGTFKDTLRVSDSLEFSIPNYVLRDGKEISFLYLKNGFDLEMTLNTEQFDETISYTGMGSAENNYLAESTLREEKERALEQKAEVKLFDHEADEFYKKIDIKMENKLDRLLNTPGLDSIFISSQKRQIENQNKNLIFNYKLSKNKLTYKEYLETFGKDISVQLAKGQPSPAFVGYDNFSGGITSLEDLKGKYVYIDIWATWCGPCKAEIPYLKKLEEAYHDKNIAFVSISVDKEKDRKKWQNMVEERSLGGIQLFANLSFKSDFVKKYEVKSIPRFILIDPDGNIVDANAPRPSYRSTLDELLQNEGVL